MPLPMAKVIEIVVKFLNRDMYQPCNIDLCSKLVRGRKKRKEVDLEEDSSEESEEESSSLESEVDSALSLDEESVERRKLGGKKKGVMKIHTVQESKEEAKAVPVSDPNVQSNIEDLTKHFK